VRLPDIKENSNALYEMFYGDIKSQVLITGIRLEIFNHLKEPRSAQWLAKRLDTQAENTLFFLNSLVCLGLLEKKQGLFANTSLSAAFLVKGLPSYLGESFLMQSKMKGMTAKDLYGLVKLGKEETPETGNKNAGAQLSEEEWGGFAKSMANNARAGVAQQMAKEVARLPEFSKFKKMLDLGSGPGIYGIALVDAHPSMKGVLFDRAPSMAVAKEFIDEYKMADRITTLAGDYNSDPLGEGYDFIWASSTLNFAQPDLSPIITKIYNALNPGGVFINISEGLTHESTQPAFFVLCTMTWAMYNKPLKAFDQGIIALAMQKAGFKSVRSRTLDTHWGPMDMDIARK